MFLLSLEGSAVARIERKVDKIYARMLQDDITQAQQSSISVASITSLLSQLETNEDDVWTILKTELLAENISMAHIMSNKEDIIEYIKSLIAVELPNDATEANSGHIYGGIANSLASPASEPVVSGRAHIQISRVVQYYEEMGRIEKEDEARLIAMHERLEQREHRIAKGQSKNAEQNRRQERHIWRCLEEAERDREELRLTERAKRRREEKEAELRISLDEVFKKPVSNRYGRLQ